MLARLSAPAAGFGLAIVPQAALAQQGQQFPGWDHSHHMWNGMWGPGGAFGLIIMLLFVALLIGLIVLAARWFAGVGDPYYPPRKPDGPGPVDILKLRFAQGEIDRADYEERLKMLQG